jgi:7-keto-8-aminopelargonate synthetase-like enzyme
MTATDKRERLWANSRALHSGLQNAGFKLATDTCESAIIAVLMPDQDTTAAMWSRLLDLGVYCNMSRPPATPAGVFLLRCSLSSEHSPEEIGEIVARFVAARDG